MKRIFGGSGQKNAEDAKKAAPSPAVLNDDAPWMPELNMEGIKLSIKGLNSTLVVPEFPTIAMDIQRELASRFPNLTTLSDIIESSPSVMGSVLAQLNGKFYQSKLKKPTDLKSVKRGMSLFGTNQVAQLGIESALKGSEFYDKEVIKRITDYSFMIARIAASIADRAHTDVQPSVAYVYGLYMRGGMIALATTFTTGYGDIFDLMLRDPVAGIQREMDTYNGVRHDYLSVAVARKWGIGLHSADPEIHKVDMSIMLAIQEQYHPKWHRIDDDGIKELIACGHLAIALANEMIHQKYQSQSTLENAKLAMHLLGVDSASLLKIKTDIAQMIYSY